VAGLGDVTRAWQLCAVCLVMSLGWCALGGAAINIILAPWWQRIPRGWSPVLASNRGLGPLHLIAGAQDGQPIRGRVRMQQHRNVEGGGATRECTFSGSGTPVVVLAQPMLGKPMRAAGDGGEAPIASNVKVPPGSYGISYRSSLESRE
jgi:hypothetical protein